MKFSPVKVMVALVTSALVGLLVWSNIQLGKTLDNELAASTIIHVCLATDYGDNFLKEVAHMRTECSKRGFSSLECDEKLCNFLWVEFHHSPAKPDGT